MSIYLAYKKLKITSGQIKAEELFDCTSILLRTTGKPLKINCLVVH